MKDISKLSILIFCLLISSIFTKSPYNRFFSRRNKTFGLHRNKYAYNYTYHYGNYRNRKVGCGPKFVLGALLLSLWSALLVLYFLLNRRKKTFTVILKSQINNNYMNV